MDAQPLNLPHRCPFVCFVSFVVNHPGLALAGNALRGVGIPDAIASGEAAARVVLDAQAGVMSGQ